MKFLIDAQLPRSMVQWLTEAGCDAVHTWDLPAGNRTTDEEVHEFAFREQRVVITKDADFVDSHVLLKKPPKLVLISTGNVSNTELAALLKPLLADIDRELKAHDFLEVGRQGLITRD